ncbi:polyprenyl synthetase family protein [Aminipila butyrica]|uniref:Polyprenyl synthetase family protein n=1 Tax=Aminipila butyrica TaxID=433296 RepID=A0A858BVS5_9FIRM|nr:polyprenyl synthetase family protein [Aminipila butyrica]QIB70043.1 polyprenyl synthetase family protein [Aminipila butyrica]
MEKTLEKKLTYEDALEQIRCEVDSVLSSSPLIIRRYTKHLALSVGKFIRAASVAACAQDENGLVPERTIKVAAAVEILHLATLVHDDVIDNADLRRGEVTLQKKFGQKTAVICGDYLVCVAMKTAASAADEADWKEKQKLQLPDYMEKICLGELNQHINNGNIDLTLHQYLRIISGKTAALFEAAFFAGASICEKDPNLLKKYMKLGRNIGMIFQLTDDCMDFEETEETAMKPVQSDYEQNVITLPLIYAFKKAADLKDKAKKNVLTRTEINTVVADTGGLSYTRLVAKKYYNRSLALIEELHAPEEKRERLKFILDKSFRLV